MDYHAQFYRKFDFGFKDFRGAWKLGTHIGLDSYIVEGLHSFEKSGGNGVKSHMKYAPVIYRAIIMTNRRIK